MARSEKFARPDRARPAGKRKSRTFPPEALEAISASRYLRIRSGDTHRFLAIWVVVVDGRVCVRSWYNKPDGWFRAFRKEPQGAIVVGKEEFPVRARLVAGRRLIDAVSAAFVEKYTSKASRKWALGFSEPQRATATLELQPG